MSPNPNLLSPSAEAFLNESYAHSPYSPKRGHVDTFRGSPSKSPRLDAPDAPSEIRSSSVTSDGSRTPSDYQWAHNFQPLSLKDNASPGTLISEFTPSTDEAPIDDQSDDESERVCFGVVVAMVSSSSELVSGEDIPVHVRPNGHLLQLYTQDTKKYAGLLKFPLMSRILSNPSIGASVSLVAISKDDAAPKSKSKSKETVDVKLSNHEHSARIVLHGSKKDGNEFAHLLSDEGHFLEPPSRAECGMDVEYHNPQYLLRPGAKMPCLDDILSLCNSDTEQPERDLEETQKSQVLRILDTAFDLKVQLQTETPSRVQTPLNRHQLNALAFMIEKENGAIEDAKFPTLWEIRMNTKSQKSYRNTITGTTVKSPHPTYGGILADEMGLGKTLSLLSLICATLDDSALRAKLIAEGYTHKTLIVAPLSTIPNWKQQIREHLCVGKVLYETYHGAKRHTDNMSVDGIDIVLTTYDTFRQDWLTQGPLFQQKWYRIVLDEAHHIRNRSTKVFKAACAIRSRNRWCLTGTPIHNSLDNYGALLTFLGMPSMEKKSDFDYWITKPFQKAEPYSLERIRSLVQSTCCRRTKSMVEDSCKLPECRKTVHNLSFNSEDQKLYDFFRQIAAKIASKKLLARPKNRNFTGSADANILPSINFLRRICDHGEQLLTPPALLAWQTRDSLSITWAMMQKSQSRCSNCKCLIDTEVPTPSQQSNGSIGSFLCETCLLNAEELTGGDQTFSDDHPRITGDLKDPGRPSAKVVSLLGALSSLRSQSECANDDGPEKSVVFTYWTTMLDLIQQALQANSFSFERIDGKMGLERREKALDRFQHDPNCTVMLATIGCAGEGINFTAANHIHLIEPQWNPMVEAQAVDRVHRIGQKKTVYVNRYIMTGSIEEYVQSVQQEKLDLVKKSVDRHTVTLDEQSLQEQRLSKLQKFLQG